MSPRPKSPDRGDRYWRTYLRKLGEDLDLAGKALAAAGTAALFAPLTSRGVVAFPTPAIGAILAVGLAAILLGLHLQATVKPDE